MHVAFLYPRCPINNKIVDDSFREESFKISQCGFSTHFFDINDIAHSKIFPEIPEGKMIVYRGWMMNQHTYSQLESRFGKQLLTSKEKYLTAHYFPNWYKHLRILTIPSFMTHEEGALECYKKIGKRVFIKDYVKSLKTGKGSIIDSGADLQRALDDMKLYRGMIEGGIVLREVVDLKKESEIRFFVMKNKIFGPPHSENKYYLAEAVLDRLISKNLEFYSVDIATKTDGTDIVIEIGDGQVSDHVGWELDNFIQVLCHLNFSENITL